MYNGIGLTTPRGSGTNGYVVRNLSHLRSRDPLSDRAADFEKGGPSLREPDQGILDHERKRKVELQCLELQLELEENGIQEDEIEAQVDALRQKLLKNLATIALPTGKALKPYDTHGIAVAKKKELLKVAHAFGTSANYVEGAAFDREKQEEEKKQRAQERAAKEAEREEAEVQRAAARAKYEAEKKERDRLRRRREYEERLEREAKAKEMRSMPLSRDNRDHRGRVFRPPAPTSPRRRQRSLSPPPPPRPSYSRRRSRSPPPRRADSRSRSPPLRRRRSPPRRSPSVSRSPINIDRRRLPRSPRSPSPPPRRHSRSRSPPRRPVDTRSSPSRSPPPRSIGEKNEGRARSPVSSESSMSMSDGGRD